MSSDVPGREDPRTAGTDAPAPDEETTASPDATAVLPGVHRGGFRRLPTAPIETTTVAGVPDASAGWPEAPAEPLPRGLAGTALVLAVAGTLASFFVGWGFPIGVAAVVVAVIALRRPIESRAVAGWALALGILSLLYSAGWLLWAATRP